MDKSESLMNHRRPSPSLGPQRKNGVAFFRDLMFLLCSILATAREASRIHGARTSCVSSYP